MAAPTALGCFPKDAGPQVPKTSETVGGKKRGTSGRGAAGRCRRAQNKRDGWWEKNGAPPLGLGSNVACFEGLVKSAF